MKVRMKKDANHRISSAITQSFKADREYSVPKATGNALVKRDVAETVVEQKPSSEKEQ
ncbi:MAG: hypothetical protein RIA08_09785 [Roseovarius sp.]|uniref:hypothetical protein n=1 Tax=Roseovarius sp. TaxID=1486281 RepID=UPI0032ECBC63